MRPHKVATYCEISRKRKRDANWNPEETRILLEQMCAEGRLLFCKQKNELVNKKKQQAWERISSKVNGSGMGLAERDIVSCKERWAKLRNKVRIRRLQAETRGGMVADMPFEDIILQLMGNETALVDAVTSIDSFDARIKKEVESVTTGYQLIPQTGSSGSMHLRPLQTPINCDVSHANGRNPTCINGSVLIPDSQDLNLSAVKIEVDELDGTDTRTGTSAVTSGLLGGFQDDSSQQEHLWLPQQSSASFTLPPQSASFTSLPESLTSSALQAQSPSTSRPQSAPPAHRSSLFTPFPQSSASSAAHPNSPAASGVAWNRASVPIAQRVPLQSSGTGFIREQRQRRDFMLMKNRSSDVKDPLFDEYLNTEIKKNRKMIQWMSSEIARNKAQQQVAELKVLKLRRDLKREKCNSV